MAEPDHAVGVDDDVVRLNLLSRQIVFGDDHAGRPSGRARQGLERIGPGLLAAEIDRGEVIGQRLDAFEIAEIAPRVADEALRMLRRAAGIVAGHAVEHLHEPLGVVGGIHDAIEIVATDAVEQRFLLPVRARHAGQPFGVAELPGKIPGRAQLDVRRRGLAGRNVGGLRAVEVVADRAGRQRVAPWLEARCREAELPLAVAHHGRGDGRAGPLGADQHALHRAFRRGTDLSGERRLWRLRLRGSGMDTGASDQRAEYQGKSA